MYKSMNRVNRINRHNRNTTEVKQSKHYDTKVSNSDEIKDTGAIMFDIPEVEAQVVDGRIVVKIDGRVMDCSQLPQWMEAKYREHEAAWINGYAYPRGVR
jgi:hypothetical protein